MHSRIHDSLSPPIISLQNERKQEEEGSNEEEVMDVEDEQVDDESPHQGTASTSMQNQHVQYPLSNPSATNIGISQSQLSNPTSTNFGISQEQLSNMMQSMFKQQMQEQFELHAQTHPKQERKRKLARCSTTANVERAVNVDEDSSGGESDQEGPYVHQSAQTARRVLWQRGHQANVPSKVEQIISAATVKSMLEAWKPLCEIGFAIIDDMSEVFAPKYRCTMEQRDYINKCA
jgi:hypothetical protein